VSRPARPRRIATHTGRKLSIAFLLVAAVAALRELALWAIVQPAPAMDTVRWWTVVAELMRDHGFFRVWTPYPPVFPALVHLGHRVVAAGVSHHHAVARMTAAWVAANCLLLAACAWLVFAICRQSLRTRASAALAATAFLLANASWRSAILVGWRMDQMEYLAIFFLLGGLLALIRRRHMLAAGLAALGTATKLFPAVLLPLILLDARGKGRWASGAVFVAVCAGLCAPGLLADSPRFLSTYRWSGDRPAWETPYRYPWQPFFAEPITPPRRRLLRACRQALPPMHDRRSDMVGLFTKPYSPPDTPARELDRARRPSTLVRLGLPLLTLAAGAVALALCGRAPDRADRLATTTLVLLLVLLVFAKGVSSYFIVWVMPLVCIRLGGLRGLAVCAVLLLVGNVEMAALTASENPATAARADPLFWSAIFVRHALLAALALRLCTPCIRRQEQTPTAAQR